MTTLFVSCLGWLVRGLAGCWLPAWWSKVSIFLFYWSVDQRMLLCLPDRGSRCSGRRQGLRGCELVMVGSRAACRIRGCGGLWVSVGCLPSNVCARRGRVCVSNLPDGILRWRETEASGLAEPLGIILSSSSSSSAPSVTGVSVVSLLC